MPRPSKHEKLLSKAEQALIAAIEIYNKPSFAYREETFSILALNAWELLLKAKLLKDNRNDERRLWTYETRRKTDGTASKNRRIVRNRSGNPKTVSLHETTAKLEAYQGSRVP